jgi:putative phosphoesterase
MRILLLSDIHANRAALEAIREDFDLCLFLGDLVDYGVEPRPCIDWVRANADFAVRGNHDHGAAQRVYVQGVGGFRYLTGVTRPKTLQMVTDDDRRYMAGLPTSLWLTLNGKRFFLVHATPRDPMDEFASPDPEAWKRRLQGIEADYVCVGHSHVQYMLQIGKTTVINPGSVGLPRDGDPRPAYAIITDEGPVLKRVDYPVDEAVAALYAAKLPEPAVNALSEVLRNGRLERKTGEPSLNGNGTAAPDSDREVRHG